MTDQIAVSATEVEGSGGASLLQPLRQRDFRLVFSGETVSLIGDQFYFIALAWLVLQLTGSGVALGTVLMVAAVPRAVFMLVGGALSDRWSPRSLMLWSNLVRGVAVGVVAALVLTGRAELWHLYLLALLFGTVDALFYPAINAMVPMLVSDKLLSAANGLVQGIQQLANLVGPALAGVLVAALETGPAFAIDALSFGVAAIALAFVAGGRRHAAARGEEPSEHLLATIGSGLRYAWADPAVRALVLIVAAVNLGFTGPIEVGIPYLADTRFAGGSAAFGLIVSGFGGGALAGAILAGSLRHIPHLGAVSLATVFGMGIGLALFALAPTALIAVAVAAIIGLGAGFTNVRVIAWLQLRTPEHFRGRVMSLVMFGSIGLGPVSLAVSGVVIDVGAASLLFLLAGGLVAAAALLGFALGIPSRMLDAPADEG